METKILEQIGLTKGEIKVYLALLRLGSTTSGPLTNESEVSRSKIYNVLERLIKKGLVSYIIKEKTKYYQAGNPSQIENYLDKKEKEFKTQRNEIKSILPKLELQQKEGIKKREAQIFTGFKGMKTAYETMMTRLKKGDEYFVLGVPSNTEKTYPHYWPKFHKQRSEKGIKAKLLCNQGVPLKELNFRKKFKNTQIKYMPIPIETPTWIIGYKDTSLITLPGKEGVTIEIKNKEITNSFKNYFESFWNQDSMILRGEDVVQKIFEEMLEHKECYFLGARGYFVDRRPEFIDKWEKKAIEKGFKMKNIVDPGTKGHRMTEFPFTETRYTLSKEFAELSVFWIYGDQVVIGNWTEKEPIITVIKNKRIYDLYKKQFEILWEQENQTYVGKQGLKLIFEDILENNSEIKVMGATGKFKEIFGEYFDDWQDKRVKNKINLQILYSESLRKEKRQLELTKIKYLEDVNINPSTTIIYKDKVATIQWSEEPIAFLINSETVAKSNEHFFNQLWKTAKP